MAGIIFSESAGLGDSIFGKSQAPIKLLIEKKAEACEAISTLPLLFAMEKSNNYAEKFTDGRFVIGENDLALAKHLVKAGSDHRKFLRQIFVSVDITAPLYWWSEFDTYKVGTVANSCSKMHTLAKKEFELLDFSREYLTVNDWDDPDSIVTIDEKIDATSEGILGIVINALNHYRKLFNETKDKGYWYKMIQLLPESYNQRRTVTMSYENLRAIRNSDRRNHKLFEWRVGFMEWIDSLPYAKDLLIGS